MAGLPPRTYIRLLKTFEAGASRDLVLERVTAYLLNCGYRQSVGTDELEFSRGRGATTSMAFSPRGWGVVVRVTVSEREGAVNVRALFTINVSGQAPSRCENAFWLAELDGLEEAVRTGDVSGRRSRRLAWLALFNNIMLAIVALLLVGGCGCLGAYGADQVQSDSLKLVFLVSGGLVGLGLAYLAARFVFGLFVSTAGLPFAPEEEKETKDG